MTLTDNYRCPDEKKLTMRTEINYEADGLTMVSAFYVDDAT